MRDLSTGTGQSKRNIFFLMRSFPLEELLSDFLLERMKGTSMKQLNEKQGYKQAEILH